MQETISKRRLFCHKYISIPQIIRITLVFNSGMVANCFYKPKFSRTSKIGVQRCQFTCSS